MAVGGDNALSGLMCNIQLCLAHYCDTHGPTPLMVTEGHPASCTLCFDDAVLHSPDAVRPRSSAAAVVSSQSHQSQHGVPGPITDALRDLNLARSASLPASEHEAQVQRALLRSSTASSTGAAGPSALETPPDSPRPGFQQPRRDSSYRRTYDETVTKRQGPCDNCAMTLPPRQANTIGDHGLTLRTRAPAERVFGSGGQASPPTSQSSSDTDGERDDPRHPRCRNNTTTASSRTTSRSTASTSSERPTFHTHYVDYTSTHEPVLPNSFSLLRASCLRALSFETLPRAPSTAQPTTSPTPLSSPSFVTTQSAGSAASGGPIFFGDALAGYTTAYIFRIPDVHARGHKRVYAFLALSTHKERLAMRTFTVISAAFRELAIWIQQLAEAEAERAASFSPVSSVLISSGGGFPQSQPQPQRAAVDRGESSFLTGGSGFTRRMGGGAGAMAPKARGLAELVGQPDFFIDLHKKFVQLLFEVGVTLNT